MGFGLDMHQHHTARPGKRGACTARPPGCRCCCCCAGARHTPTRADPPTHPSTAGDPHTCATIAAVVLASFAAAIRFSASAAASAATLFASMAAATTAAGAVLLRVLELFVALPAPANTSDAPANGQQVP